MVALVFGLTVVSCGKKEAPAPVAAVPDAAVPVAPAPAAKVNSSPAPAPQMMPAASPTIASSASSQAAAEQMTLELRKYVAYTRTIPKNFEDFVARHPMTYPAAPIGKKYVIQGAQVVVR